MAQTQATEKLHAACDECRTRKLKCSGEKPVCGRCQREKIECIYSPQKTMGRPRKRRREDGTDAPAEVPATIQNGHDSTLNGFATAPGFSSFGLLSPPEFADLPSGNEVYAQAQHDPSLVGLYGPSPSMTNLEYVEDYRTSVHNPHNRSFGLTPPIDPSLWGSEVMTSVTQTGYQPADQDTPPDQTVMGPCTCLSLTYLTLTDLQTVPTFSFPQVIIPLRKAMATISSLIHCPICPLDPFSAIQNVSSLASLFKAIVERFSKILHEVDLEASRLATSGQKKPYRIGDNNPALSHLHTGTLDCPMGFNIELEPDVWRKLVKTALKTEMYGGGSNPTPLKQLLKETEERQQRWHNDQKFMGNQRGRLWGQEHCKRDKGVCESLGEEHIRRAIGMLVWE